VRPPNIDSSLRHCLFDIISLGVDATYVMTRTHARQFTLVHVAKCHSKIS